MVKLFLLLVVSLGVGSTAHAACKDHLTAGKRAVAPSDSRKIGGDFSLSDGGKLAARVEQGEGSISVEIVPLTGRGKSQSFDLVNVQAHLGSAWVGQRFYLAALRLHSASVASLVFVELGSAGRETTVIEDRNIQIARGTTPQVAFLPDGSIAAVVEIQSHGGKTLVQTNFSGEPRHLLLDANVAASVRGNGVLLYENAAVPGTATFVRPISRFLEPHERLDVSELVQHPRAPTQVSPDGTRLLFELPNGFLEHYTTAKQGEKLNGIDTGFRLNTEAARLVLAGNTVSVYADPMESNPTKGGFLDFSLGKGAEFSETPGLPKTKKNSIYNATRDVAIDSTGTLALVRAREVDPQYDRGHRVAENLGERDRLFVIRYRDGKTTLVRELLIPKFGPWDRATLALSEDGRIATVVCEGTIYRFTELQTPLR